MKTKNLLPNMTKTLLAFVFAADIAVSLGAAPMGTGFTYQGRLNDGGAPANGLYDFQFSLFDGPITPPAGQVGTTLSRPVVGVTNGLFTVTLNFGPLFQGDARWLEILANTNGFLPVPLTPRQELTPQPYAIFAGTAATVTNQAITTLQLAPNAVTGPTIVDGNVVRSLNGLTDVLKLAAGANISLGTLGDTITISGAAGGGPAWLLNGNAGTTPGTHFLGTTDDQPLEIKVHGLRALRLEDNGDGAPNLIGGSPVNFVGTGVLGATIGGGGATNYYGKAYTNSVKSDFGVVSGGLSNNIANNSPYATIAGGGFNDIGANSDYSTIGGGGDNYIAAISYSATIAGGVLNDIGNDSGWSTIGGGSDNNIAADTFAATIAGGGLNNIGTNSFASAVGGGEYNNIADNSSGATIAGGEYNHIGTNSFASAVGGGSGNNIADNSLTATIAGGLHNIIGTDSGYSAIGGGSGNNVSTDSYASAIGGGFNNTNAAHSAAPTIAGGGYNDIGTNSNYSAIGGGFDNNISDNSISAAIAGGINNQVSASSGFIGGGSGNWVLFAGGAATIGGGLGNNANAGYSAIAGGQDNAIEFIANYGSIGGGHGNRIKTGGSESTVGGGFGNLISGASGTISGGGNNAIEPSTSAAIGGGASNTNSGSFAFIGGGQSNLVQSQAATINGGTRGWIDASSIAATVGGGDGNQVRSGRYSSILGGRSSTLSDAYNSSVVGGGENYIGTLPGSVGYPDYAAILAGRMNTNAATYGTILGGQGVLADKYGQVAFGSRFATNGDAQASFYHLRGISTPAGSSELFLNGSNARLVLATNAAWTFHALVIAKTVDGVFAFGGLEVKGVVINDLGTVYVTANTTSLGGGAGAFSVNALADIPNQALIFRVSCSNSGNTRWSLHLRTAEIIAPGSPQI